MRLNNNKQILSFALLLAGSFVQTATAQTQSASWITAWTAAPSLHALKSTGDNGLIFSNQTEREILHTTIGGTSARLHLSNQYGSTPLVIGDVHIAQRDTDAAIIAGTDRAVTFGGSASVSIPVGGTIVSDAISFAVPARADVAVSIYFPGGQTILNTTAHQFTEQTNFFATGDSSGATTLPNALQTGNYYFVTGLDVQGPSLTGSVVALGASITAGYASTGDTNRRWPDLLALRFAGAGINMGIANMGIAGNELLHDNGEDGPSALNRFNRDVLSQAGVRYVIFSDDPINDLGGDSSIPASQFIGAIQTLITQAHNQGLKFICSTLTPYQGSMSWNSQGEATRDQINTFIHSSTSTCDGVIDQDLATHDPNNPNMYLPAFDSGDHLHPNDAGYQAIANAIDLSLFTGNTSQITLSNEFNRIGLVADGTSFPNGGLDGANGSAYSSTLLGSSLTFNGVNLSFGAPNQINAISAAGQTIALSAGQFGSLLVLGTGVNGNQTGQVFKVSYTDGSTSSITQSFSDWFTPQNYPGEAIAASTPYRDNFNGSKDGQSFSLYGYTLLLNPAKTVKSVTLPNNQNVELLAMALSNGAMAAVTPDQVLVLINNGSSISRAIGTQYASKRSITNILRVTSIDSSLNQNNETIDFADYQQQIETPLRSFLASHPQINYIVTTKGIPIRINGAPTGEAFSGNTLTSLDSNLAALDYDKNPGAVKITFNDPAGSAVGTAWLNRYWNATTPFNHAQFGGYLVTRLDGYTQADAEALTTRALAAEKGITGGPVLLDGEPDFDFADPSTEPAPIPGTLITTEDPYSAWNGDMEHAAEVLTSRKLNVKFDQSRTFVGGPSQWLGYFSWGSNDDNFSQTSYNSLRFAPGAIGDTAVSSSARSFFPQSSGQTLIADLIAQGITGVKGYTDEPLLQGISSPTIVLERFTRGFNLAESFYAGSHFVGWTDIVLGDPLCHPYAQKPPISTTVH